jgi:hypothetical protein
MKGHLMAFLNTPVAQSSMMSRAKKLAERIVASMQVQGYLDIKYTLTEGQLKIVASKTGGAPQTLYLTLPE